MRDLPRQNPKPCATRTPKLVKLRSGNCPFGRSTLVTFPFRDSVGQYALGRGHGLRSALELSQVYSCSSPPAEVHPSVEIQEWERSMSRRMIWVEDERLTGWCCSHCEWGLTAPRLAACGKTRFEAMAKSGLFGSNPQGYKATDNHAQVSLFFWRQSAEIARVNARSELNRLAFLRCPTHKYRHDGDSIVYSVCQDRDP
jgi:hypothetical protein